MGWLKKLPLRLGLLLAGSVYLVKTTGTAIALAPPSNPFDRDSYDAFPKPQIERLPASVMPVPERQQPHSRPSVQPFLPADPFPTFNSQQFDQQLQRYLHFVAEFGSPDILIVGSSRALIGIDPAILQQTLASRGYPKLKIFNFGINGATAQLVNLLVSELLTPEQLPRLLLWGDGVRAFNSGRIDMTYDRAIASPGYQLLAAGIHPVLTLEKLPQKQQLCTTSSLPLSSTEAIKQAKYFNFVTPLTPTLKLQQGCWDSLRKLSQPESSLKFDQTITSFQERTGFESRFEQFKPVVYFQRHPQVQGEYDADYRNFTLNGKQTDALNHVVTFAQVRRIPVIFINLPLTQIYLDRTRTLYEWQFRMYLQQLTQSQMVKVYDLGQRWSNQNDYFIDPSHLNRYGAAAVAEQIGRLLTVPPLAQP